ncbi:hypothetical protein NVSP9465_03922 [Novosphingobium sp. CECT 9465]|nr:hypothetical protein NVSP9465_03922 [Novosphingobium sp. CECT 9465]
MNLGKAVGLFCCSITCSGSNNYHEMVDRLNGHISRWEDINFSFGIHAIQNIGQHTLQ